MWGYRYIDLTAEQKIARRSSLDWAGYQVILSQFAVATALSLYIWLSPGHAHSRTAAERLLRRLAWRLSGPTSLRHPELRCLGDWIVVVAWMSWCTFLSVAGSGNDYLHLTKAFGIVTAANFPLHFMLAMKRSPLRILYGVSYEGQANFLHRWVGRTIGYLLMCHGGLYLNFFWDTNRMTTRFLEFDVLCGFIGLMVISIISLTANHWVRNWSYRVFFLVHVTLSPLIFPLMFFHVSYLRIYLWPTIALYTTDQLLRYLLRTPATATITRLSPTLIAIHASPTHEIPLQPGTHAILRHPAISYTSHPFSITSSGPTKRIRMVARIHSGFTKKLAEGTKKELAIILDLPYGAPLFFPDLGKFEKVLFVAGGVGATFATSWVKFLMRGSESRPPPARLGQLRFVWAVRTAEDALWALQDDYTGDNAKDLARCVELYITGSGEGEEGVEMMEGLLAANGGGVDALVRAGVARERIFTGRPVLGRIIHDVARKEGGGAGTTAVLACGPKMMGSVVKRAVARLGAEGADVWLHVEEFGH